MSRTIWATGSTAFMSRAASSKWAPSWAKAKVMAWPMPLAGPVIKTIFFSSESCMAWVGVRGGSRGFVLERQLDHGGVALN